MKNYIISELVDAQGFLTCSVCSKKFKPNDDTKYIIAGGYVCAWKCFLNEVNRRKKEKIVTNKRRIKT